MMSFFWKLFRPILFLFPAEMAHELAIGLLKKLKPILRQRKSLRIDSSSSSNSLGFPVMNPIGLAAGLDKNAEIFECLPTFGFGFAEIGTVTEHPQPGNPKPRLFRIPKDHALFNRMGFNNHGASSVSKNLKSGKKHLPPDFSIGVNLGKNKDTSPEDAADNYIRACQSFRDQADYLVVNVSSPNTPGLRSLQSFETLKPILNGLDSEVKQWAKVPPVYVKLAPELFGDDLQKLIPVLDTLPLHGYILTNTLQSTHHGLTGGLSGAPLQRLSLQSLGQARSLTSKPIISVGGISTAADIRRRLDLGAQAVQVYTAWIYKGPSFLLDI